MFWPGRLADDRDYRAESARGPLEEAHGGALASKIPERSRKKEASPPKKANLSPKPVRDKHFISRWFIRDHWADGPNTTRWRRSGETWSKDRILFGSWGHRQGLWSDRWEAYFGLLEGDAKRPLQMLLAVEPLNQPQQLAFVAHLVVHLLRNPRFVEGLRISMRGMIESAAVERGDLLKNWRAPRMKPSTKTMKSMMLTRGRCLWSRWAIGRPANLSLSCQTHFVQEV